MNIKLSVLMVPVILFSACLPKENRLLFREYTKLRLGFTTQSFIESVPVTKDNIIKLVDYAASNGFWWFELRDPDAILTLEECKQISTYASEKGIEIAYAIQSGLLDEDYWEVFNRGVKNAAVFKGPGTFRSPACGREFENDSTKKGWTPDEFKKILLNAAKAAMIAGENGVKMIFENGNEAFNGNDSVYFGTTDLLKATNNSIGWQFDVANPFSGSRVPPSPEEVLNTLYRYCSRMYYIHLKSSVNGYSMPVLLDNPVPFDKVFRLMEEKSIPYVAIELVSQVTTEETERNLDESISSLKRNGFIK